MKKFLSQIWVPALAVAFVTVQTFGMDVVRAVDNREAWEEAHPIEVTDTIIYDNSGIYTKFRAEYNSKAEADTVGLDSLGLDSTEVFISARDTMKVPDSLRFTDPFRYKYYVAIKDSLTHVIVRDSLKQAGDSLDWPKLDSLYRLDSIETAQRKFREWYASLDKAARKKYDFERKMERMQRKADSLMNVSDSLKAIKDSIIENTPRILETFAIPDSMFYKRLLTWNRDNYFNTVRLNKKDTSYNYYFNEYPFYHKDVDVTYLGIIGSPVQSFDFGKRTYVEDVYFYKPYEIYSFSPSTLPMYNTKTPYTELAYWGTLFANSERGENNLHLMTTQNILPSLNFLLEYDRFGANGMLENETTDNRTFVAAVNFLGKRYAGHTGYIYNKIGRDENGGVTDTYWIRDTTVGSREIDVNLTEANNLIKKNTVFLDQTYRIPFNFINNLKEKKVVRKDRAYRDSVLATGDSIAIEKAEEWFAARENERAEAKAKDTLNTDITTAFIGHNSEYSVYRKVYTDKIESSDADGRAFYHDNFFLNPTTSNDSIRVMKFDNKFFIKLQPWKSDAIVSSLNVGIGDKLMNYYMFSPQSYLTGAKNTVWNSTYLYGGVGGMFKKYFAWDAIGSYTFAGKEANDFNINANASMSIYPFRRHRTSPLSLRLHFETSLKEADFYEQNYYSNHYVWNNDFDKKSTTKLEATMSIPHWGLSLEGGYTLLKNYVYYDSLSMVKQFGGTVSVAKLALTKNFKIANIHLDNRVLFQVSSNEDILPLPKLAVNLRWYYQFNIVKNVMQMQLGVNGTFNTNWYAPGYSPALGVYFNQKREKFGNNPYFDVFANIQWKRACIFVKLINAGQGWPMDKYDYFSAAGYIKPQRALKLGICWPFYMQPARNKAVSASGSLGGGSSSSGRSSSGRSGIGGTSLSGLSSF